MEKMLITQALNELKTLDARINRGINKADFIEAAKISDSNIIPGVSKEEFRKEAEASYASIQDLIKRRRAIKSAIMLSNAKTTVEINGEEMTVAEAIDLKKAIKYQELLLHKMRLQKDECIRKVTNANMKMDQQIDAMLSTMYGKDCKDKITADQYDNVAGPYKLANEYGPEDPLKISKKIEELENYIEEFKSKVDAKLQISNCVTTIEF